MARVIQGLSVTHRSHRWSGNRLASIAVGSGASLLTMQSAEGCVRLYF